MFLIRRSAFKAISKPAIPFLAKQRSISSVAPAISRISQQWSQPILAKRFYSDEASKPLSTQEVSESSSTTTITEPPVAAEEKQVSPNSENVLYVGNLFFEVNEEALRNIASKFGPITEARIVYDNRGLSRGFGFITFQNREDAQAAIDNLHQQTFAGRRMVIQFHVPRRGTPRTLAQPAAPHAPSKVLFIGNMSFEMSDKDLNDLFREIQGVLDVRVAMDRRTGQPRGFAHADFVSVEAATKAKEQLQNKSIYGRELRIDFGVDARANERSRRLKSESQETTEL